MRLGGEARRCALQRTAARGGKLWAGTSESQHGHGAGVLTSGSSKDITVKALSFSLNVTTPAWIYMGVFGQVLPEEEANKFQL